MKIRILSFTSFSCHALKIKVVMPTMTADQKAAMRTIVSIILFFGNFILFYRSVTNVVRRVEKTTESSNNNNKRGYHANKTKDGGSIACERISVRSHRLIALKKNRRPATVMMPVSKREVLVTSINSVLQTSQVYQNTWQYHHSTSLSSLDRHQKCKTSRTQSNT